MAARSPHERERCPRLQGDPVCRAANRRPALETAAARRRVARRARGREVRVAAHAGAVSRNVAVCVAGVTASDPPSEDCLYLNVWTKIAAGEKKPVMVWIHGGAWTRGGIVTDLRRHSARQGMSSS